MVKCLCSHQEAASWWEEGQEHADMLGECVVFGPHFLHFTQAEVSDQAARVFNSSYFLGLLFCASLGGRVTHPDIVD